MMQVPELQILMPNLRAKTIRILKNVEKIMAVGAGPDDRKQPSSPRFHRN
jgi:hypothetical protein